MSSSSLSSSSVPTATRLLTAAYYIPIQRGPPEDDVIAAKATELRIVQKRHPYTFPVHEGHYVYDEDADQIVRASSLLWSMESERVPLPPKNLMCQLYPESHNSQFIRQLYPDETETKLDVFDHSALDVRVECLYTVPIKQAINMKAALNPEAVHNTHALAREIDTQSPTMVDALLDVITSDMSLKKQRTHIDNLFGIYCHYQRQPPVRVLRLLLKHYAPTNPAYVTDKQKDQAFRYWISLSHFLIKQNWLQLQDSQVLCNHFLKAVEYWDVHIRNKVTLQITQVVRQRIRKSEFKALVAYAKNREILPWLCTLKTVDTSVPLLVFDNVDVANVEHAIKKMKL